MSSYKTLRERTGDHVQFCSATTKAGDPCSLPVVEGSQYCWRHDKDYQPAEITQETLQEISRVIYLEGGNVTEASRRTGISVGRIRRLQYAGALSKVKLRPTIVSGRDLELVPVALMKTSDTTWTTIYGEMREE